MKDLKFLSALIFPLLLVVAPVLQAQGQYQTREEEVEAILAPWPKEEWPALQETEVPSYEDLCSYDSLCRKLKGGDDFKVPHPLILKIFALQKDRLSAIAKKYEIHPLIPLAAITVEHSLNVGIEDQIQDSMRGAGLDINGRLMGIQKVSYGYGQLYDEAAMEAEQIVARIEGRRPEDGAYVNSRISSIEGAYEYAAALMTYYKEAYQRAGYDIANNPGILTTLYNIGKAEERVDRTLESGREPQVNYFGWFAVYNWESFENVFDDEGMGLEYLADQQMSMQERGNDGGLGRLIGLTRAHQVQAMSIPFEVPLRDNPPACDVDRDFFVRKQNIRWRDQAFLESQEDSQLLPYRGKGSFDIYAKSWDCLGRVWALVRFHETSHLGWINLESLSPLLEMETVARQCESREISQRCLQEVTQTLEDENAILDTDGQRGMVFLRLGHHSKDETSPVNWRLSDRHNCSPERVASLEEDLIAMKGAQSRREEAKKSGTIEGWQDEITNAWMDHWEATSRPSERDASYREEKTDLLQKAVDRIREDQIKSGETPFTHIMSDEDIVDLTPLVLEAIASLEKDFNIVSPSWLTVRSLDPIRGDNGAALILEQTDSMFLYPILQWAYEFREYCLNSSDQVACIASKPLEEIKQAAQDLIKNGFQSEFAMSQLGYRDFERRWFHSALLRDWWRVSADYYSTEVWSLTEFVEIIRPDLEAFSDESEAAQRVLQMLDSKVQQLQGTPFGDLKVFAARNLVYFKRDLQVIGNKYKPGSIALPQQDESFFGCTLDVWIRTADPKGYPQFEKVPCQYFHLMPWTDEQVYQTILKVIGDPVDRIEKREERLQEYLASGKLPEIQHMRNIEEIEERLANCNYDYEQTAQKIKKLSQVFCFQGAMIPSEKLLMRRSRQLGLIFQTMPMAYESDRFAIKVETQCQ